MPEGQREFSIALASAGNNSLFSWQPFRPFVSAKQIGNGLELRITPDTNTIATGKRLRLSMAFSGLPVRHSMLPLYQGGMSLTIAAAPYSAAEPEITLLPANPFHQAMCRILQNGMQSDAKGLFKAIFEHRELARKLIDDPWATLTACLLCLRFPQVLSKSLLTKLATGITPLSHTQDAQVVLAALALQQARQPAGLDKGIDESWNIVSESLMHLHQATMSSSPYFSFSNQIIGQQLNSIEGWINTQIDRLPSTAEQHISRLAKIWRKNQRMQYAQGLIYCWNNPTRKSTDGKLNETYSTTLISGKISPTGILSDRQQEWIDWLPES